MKAILADPALVARCGLYCGACPKYLKDRCPGCNENDRATWCKTRACCMDAGFSSCAECETHSDPKDCVKFHNLFSRIVGFFLRSDRHACIMQIKKTGLEEFARVMASGGRMTIKPSAGSK